MKDMILALAASITLLTLVNCAQSLMLLPQIEAPIYDLKLSQDLLFQWQVDYQKEEIYVQVSLFRHHGRDWIAIGFSDYGQATGADLCVFWTDWKGNAMLDDGHTSENETLIQVDQHQDCLDFNAEFTSKGIVFAFTRKFDTCDDPFDYLLEDGTTHVIWAHGQGPLYDVNNLNIADKGIGTFGFSRTRLLKVLVDEDFPQDARGLEIKHAIDLPSDDTTYWCSVHKLPNVFKQKHHALQYEPILTKGNEHLLHHMEVFHCVPEGNGDSEEFPIWSGPCGSDEAPEKLQHCKKVLAAWAIGAGPFTYPSQAGLQIGGADFGSLYVMLEVHFNNENLESGVKDNSGMRFIVSQQLRSHDAGIMELGLVYTDKMAIPPSQQSFPLHGYCLPQCSAVGFPSNGIHIFGSQLHTHGTGVQVETRHFRDGQELEEINRDDHYSTHFQEIRPLHSIRQVLPGDELVTTCWYSTKDKEKAVVGGYTFEEEMCVNYIHYYPRAKNLEICKSSVDGQALKSYFDLLKKWDGQTTDSETKNTTENYKSIHWTPLRAAALADFYDKAPLEMQCQSGAGLPLPGNWRNMSRPSIDLNIDKPIKGCDPLEIEEKMPRFAKEKPLLMKRQEAVKRIPEEEQQMNSMKRAGMPMNEMRRSLMKKAKLLKYDKRRKKDKEQVEFNYQNTLDYEEDEDFSKYWTDYETWGYDKRGGLGSIGQSRKRKKRLGKPMNEMRRSSTFDNDLEV